MDLNGKCDHHNVIIIHERKKEFVGVFARVCASVCLFTNKRRNIRTIGIFDGRCAWKKPFFPLLV